MADWNWFFSTYAQCGAAIIGIIGAFVISRIIDITSKIHAARSDIFNMLNEGDKLREQIREIDIPMYNTKKIKKPEIRRAIIEGSFDEKDDNEIYNILIYNFDVYRNDSVLIALFRDYYDRYIISKKDIVSIREEKIRKRNHLEKFEATDDTELDDIRYKFEEFRIKVIKHTLVVNENHVKLRTFQKSLEFIKNIIIVLFVSFFAVVIYPLHFLPSINGIKPDIQFNLKVLLANISDIKGILLILFSLLISVIIIIFLKNLRDLGKEITGNIELCLSQSLRKYFSQYF